jgi:ABC-type transport system substrate-binding protein
LEVIKTSIYQHLFLLIFQLFLLILFGSCKDKTMATEVVTRAINAGEIRITLPQSAQEFDPSASNVNNEILLRQVYEGLLEQSGEEYVKSALVEKMTVDSTRKSFQFQLKVGIRFSDGSKLDSASLVGWIYDKEQLGFNISFRKNILTIGYNNFNYRAATQLLISHKMLIYRKIQNNIIGTGAFYVEKFAPNSHISLSANEYYFNKDYPKTNRLKVQFSDNPTFAVDNFLALENDLLLLAPQATIQLRDSTELLRYKANTFIDSGQNIHTYAYIENPDSIVLGLLKAKFQGLIFLNDKSRNMILQNEDSLNIIAYDSIPIIVTNDSFFSDVATDRLLFGTKGLPTDSSRSIHIFSLANLRNPVNLEEVVSNYQITLNIEPNNSLVLLNSQYGKIVYQYYIKNIEYINNVIIDFKKLELQKAEILN